MEALISNSSRLKSRTSAVTEEKIARYVETTSKRPKTLIRPLQTAFREEKTRSIKAASFGL